MQRRCERASRACSCVKVWLGNRVAGSSCPPSAAVLRLPPQLKAARLKRAREAELAQSRPARRQVLLERLQAAAHTYQPALASQQGSGQASQQSSRQASLGEEQQGWDREQQQQLLGSDSLTNETQALQPPPAGEWVSAAEYARLKAKLERAKERFFEMKELNKQTKEANGKLKERLLASKEQVRARVMFFLGNVYVQLQAPSHGRCQARQGACCMSPAPGHL